MVSFPLLDFLATPSGYEYLKQQLYDQEIMGSLIRHHLYSILCCNAAKLEVIGLAEWPVTVPSLGIVFNSILWNSAETTTTYLNQAMVSVPAYFKEVLNIELKYPDLPCIVVLTNGMSFYIPLELITIKVLGNSQKSDKFMKLNAFRWRPLNNACVEQTPEMEPYKMTRFRPHSNE